MSRPSPDPTGTDESGIAQSEALDEEDLGADPLEGAMDPPEDWAGADLRGTTAAEQADDGPLDERLAEERQDVAPGGADEVEPERPIAETPLDELDDSIDDVEDIDHIEGETTPEEPLSVDGGVLVGTEDDETGESATRRTGYLIAEPDEAARDEVAAPREE